VSLFADFHRSIVDRKFYAEIARRSPGYGVRYVAILVALSAVLTGAVRTYRAWDPQDGILPALGGLLGTMRIDDGVLRPDRPGPYFLDQGDLARLWAVVADAADPDTAGFDSLVVIDTGGVFPSGAGKGVRVFLRKRSIEVATGRGVVRSIGYGALFPVRTVAFTPQEFRPVLRMLTPMLAAFYLARDLISSGSTVLFAVVLFSTATYIFKTPRVVNLRGHARVACFATGPLVAGITLMALANSHHLLGWYVFFVVALFIHVRGVDTAAKAAAPV
jgi:hypothetical protein